jgi:plastin-1
MSGSMNIVKTLTSLSGKGKPISDTEMVKWANAQAAKKAGSRPIRSFKDPSLATGIFFLDVLEGLRPGIVDPSMILNVSETSDYEDRKQNGAWSSWCFLSLLMLTEFVQRNWLSQSQENSML